MIHLTSKLPLPSYEPHHEKPVFAIYKQQRRSLISTFVVRCLDSIIPPVSVSGISSLYLASVAAQACFGLPEDRFSRGVAHMPLKSGRKFPLAFNWARSCENVFYAM